MPRLGSSQARFGPKPWLHALASDQEEEFIRLYAELTVTALSEIFGMTRKTATTTAKRLGLPRKPAGKPRPKAPTPDLRYCTICKEFKPLTEFYKEKSSSDGLDWRCKDCSKKRRREFSAANPEWQHAYNTAYRETHRDYFQAYARERYQSDPEYMKMHRDLRRAREKNAPISEVIHRLVVAERDNWTCGLCGDPIDPNASHRLENGRNNPEYLNIDHIIPLSKGGDHLYANVQATHARCNNKKLAKILDNDLDVA